MGYAIKKIEKRKYPCQKSMNNPMLKGMKKKKEKRRRER
jgi:hypothetical protein